MKAIISTTVILLVSSSLSYGKCALKTGPIPHIPDANTATLEEMLESRSNVTHYMEAAGNFVQCTTGRGDRRTARVLKKMRRLAKNSNQADTIFSARAAKESSQLLAQNSPN